MVIKESDFDLKRDFVSFTLFLIFISSIVFLAISVIVIPIVEWTDSYDEKIVETKIVSLRDSTTISGNFFIGSGKIDSNEQYILMKKVSKDTYTRIYIPCNKTLIRETNEVTPRLIENLIRPNMNWWIGPHLGMILVNWSAEKRTIVVPEGTITINFDIK